MRYEDVSNWSRLFELIANRVSVINQVLGARFDGDMSNPVHLSYERGRYVCEVCGVPFVDFAVYDLEATSSAFARIDDLSDGIWLLNRSGRLNFT